MLALISPAKKLDFESEWSGSDYSQPELMDHARELVELLRGFSKTGLQSLMKLSDKLGTLNHARYQSFTTPFTPANARPAISAFRGDTYIGLDADTLGRDDMIFAQEHLRILSGLYGLLRPLDLMQAYRLEMGTKLHNSSGEDLYDFWGDLLTQCCNKTTKGHKNRAVINLASHEYIKAINPDKLESPFITCHFKEIRGGAAKVIGLYAKRARGAMARYLVKNRIEEPEALKRFDVEGYAYDKRSSDETNYVFMRLSEK
ncbi:MAG: peroxide stress protein YaaA [Alphaproteobacteria bacterium]